MVSTLLFGHLQLYNKYYLGVNVAEYAASDILLYHVPVDVLD